MTVTLAQLLEGSPTPEVARPNEPVAEAMERMREHDYSQLPVVEDGAAELRVIGLISMATIARAVVHLNAPPSQVRVSLAIDRHPTRCKLSDELWHALDVARNGEVLLVEDEDGVLRGILTGHDFTTYLRREAEDRLTVRDIEATIKQLISDHYRDRPEELREIVERELGVQHRDTEKGVRAVVSRCLTEVGSEFKKLAPSVFTEAFQKSFPNRVTYEFDRLTFSQYQNIFLTGECWETYKEDFGLSVEYLRALLDVARDLRNRIAHDRGLPNRAERDKLVFCRELLDRVADRRSELIAAVVEPVVMEAAAEPEAADHEGGAREIGDNGEQSFVPWKWLKHLEDTRVALRFDVIEQHNGNPLPPPARIHRSWWTNEEEAPQAVQWLDAGMRVSGVNIEKQTVLFDPNTTRDKALIKVFGRLLQRLRKQPHWSQVPSPSALPYQNLTQLDVNGCKVQLNIGFTDGDRFRISIYIDGPEQSRNKATYDTLAADRDKLERFLSNTLVWHPNPHRRSSRVLLMYPREVSIMASDEAIEQLAEWVAEYVPRFWTAVRECLGVSEGVKE